MSDSRRCIRAAGSQSTSPANKEYEHRAVRSALRAMGRAEGREERAGEYEARPWGSRRELAEPHTRRPNGQLERNIGDVVDYRVDGEPTPLLGSLDYGPAFSANTHTYLFHRPSTAVPFRLSVRTVSQSMSLKLKEM